MVHLHTRSWFSWLGGGSSPESLVERAAALGFGALAITDRNGVYGAVRFQKACRAAGIRPIVGAEVSVIPSDLDGAGAAAPVVLIARSAAGYAGLNRLLTLGHFASRESPAVTMTQLAEHSADLFCLSGAHGSYLYRSVTQGFHNNALGWLERLREIYGDRFFVELAHHQHDHSATLVTRLHELAAKANVPTVASGDVRYATRDDYGRYDLLTCIRHGITVFTPHPERPANGEACMKSERALRYLIPFPEAFENTEAIAAACEIDLIPGYVTPPEALTAAGVTPRELLEALCMRALENDYPEERREQGRKQLRTEITVISRLDLQEYFLVVREVVARARSMGIRCAGRGSAANSIVAYLLGITGVDPLAHNLLFERFLHGGRKGTPDIDIDFDSERREEVIAWIEERFTHEHTAMTANVVTYQMRMAVRDAAKALGWDPEQANKLSHSVPSHGPSKVGEYRERLAMAVGDSPMIDTLIRAVEMLAGCPRHLGQHSGGMLLSRKPLAHFMPVQVAANGVTLAQFNKDDVEALGLIKLDILGLRMLATLSMTVELVGRHEEIALDIDGLPLDDARTFNLIRSGKTIGVFQVESQGQMHLLAQHQPDDFNDLISEIALFRPGPLQSGMVNPFIRRRRGLEPVEYLHDDLKPILADTYGVILFQEQVLDIAHRFAGMPLQEADDFRSLMSKFRDPGEMEGMRHKFVSGAIERGVDEESAHAVFNNVAHFVGYGFCRSHAAAFAKTVYQSGWLKCYHPAAFMAALMQHHPGMYNRTTLEEEAKRFGARVLLPEINRSDVRYDLERAHDGALAIRKPLASIKGIKPEVARTIVLARGAEPFTSVEDFYRRVELDRDMYEAIARSGALDALANEGRGALWEIGACIRRIKRAKANETATLFDEPAILPADLPELPYLTLRERLSWDYQTHGAPRVHPMVLVRRSLAELEVRTVATCHRFFGSRRRVAPLVLTLGGIATLRQMPPTANEFMFVTLEDETGWIQCIASPEIREKFPLLLDSSALIVRGEVHIQGNWRGVQIREAWRLDGMFGGYTGFPSAYGGTDRHVTEAEPAEPPPIVSSGRRSIRELLAAPAPVERGRRAAE